MPDPTPSTSPLAILAGGRELAVRFLDGTEKNIKVRLLKIAEYAAFFAAIDNEEQLAEHLCAEQSGWAAQLTPTSILDILEAGMELNFTSARRWAERRAKLGEAAKPFVDAFRKISGQSSPSSAPTPAS